MRRLFQHGLVRWRGRHLIQHFKLQTSTPEERRLTVKDCKFTVCKANLLWNLVWHSGLEANQSPRPAVVEPICLLLLSTMEQKYSITDHSQIWKPSALLRMRQVDLISPE
ncbi:hypothetical protein AVEN_41311-1 [Araneus ventricosus]|uniref:Uncharacterized protein n=1 Tax=Araneus ventricosus TaxID=182803 RepID=A0A4Y2NHD3_ARAVE|nr:hypothetical protein AVEN_41311-1 [Araneus ventricosus]